MSLAAVHWNGATWSAATLPSGMSTWFIAASAPAASDIWAVTFEGGWILHYNGSKWTVAKHLTGNGELTGVTALSAKNVWVFGGGGSEGGLGTWHFDGTTWKKWTTGLANGLENATAVSASDIWAVGSRQAPYDTIVRFNGKTWSLANAKGIPAGQWTFWDLRVVSDKDVWVPASEFLNNSEVPFLLHYNGTSWTKLALPWAVPTGQSSEIRAITPDGHGGLWFSGFTISGGDNSVTTFYMVRRTAAGQWLRTKIGASSNTGLSGASLTGIAQVPGTGSVWGAGFSEASSGGGSAVIWAYGTTGV
jgi:hypothetical protein